LEILKKNKINWPKKVDSNWQAAWYREVLEETGINLDKFKHKLIFDLKKNHNFMMGAEPDRLVNIDGKFCAFLGELEKAPKTVADNETEELRWIALDEIYFDKKNYLLDGKIVNLYAVTLIEEGLFAIICHQIKEISKIINPFTKQQVSRFNTPQNLQSFLILNSQIKRTKEIKEFLNWEFGELEVGKNLCGKNGDRLYEISLQIAATV
jgi:ADP-ribose pyrophosphatase YjhB (NUDIX family)